MCHGSSCRPIHRNVCLCLAIYILFGLRIPCGILCVMNKNSKPEEHLNLLFSSITNGSEYMSEVNLTTYLKRIGLFKENTEHEHADHDHDEHQCYSADELLNLSKSSDNLLDKQEFASLLPTFLYQIYTESCKHKHADTSSSLPLFDWKAFLAGSAAVLLVSVSGLIVVCLVPLMSRSFYNVVTQFLIALSVGSLTGDAFLHLIPHALHGDHNHNRDHDHSNEESSGLDAHKKMILQALVVLLGIYAFFLTERLTILCQNRMSRRKLKRQQANGVLPSGVEFSDVAEKDENTNPKVLELTNPRDQNCSDDYVNTANHKLQNHVLSGDDYLNRKCKDPNNPNAFHLSVPEGLGSTDQSSSLDSQFCNRPPDRPMDNNRCDDYLNSSHFVRIVSTTLSPKKFTRHNQNQSKPHDEFSCEKLNPDNIDSEPANPADHHNFNQSSNLDSNAARSYVDDSQTKSNGQLNQDQSRGPADPNLTLKPSSSFTYLGSAEQLHTHPHRDKPHGHHHGHSHDLSSVRAIAYTIIAGDGLHNFCDGIAIGAAFANDLRGGLSTAIAVLCHELPHELGDFAVLLHAGMSIKTALFYNLLSSLLCAAGMVIGLLLGRFHSMNAWLFMLAAGMFVYIALVDMMPELSTNQLKGNKRCHQPSILFLWQNLGIIMGYSIMLQIALFEHEMIKF